MRILNESAIKEHALACSKTFKGGKFTRVGSDFIEEVEADVEAFVRRLQLQNESKVHPPLATNLTFRTGALMVRVSDEFDAMIARMIQNKVQAQPTVGCTLSRTR
jgi:hypothetical protein